MHRVSRNYKEIMNRPLRNRAYMTVSVGVVNQEAQANGYFSGEYAQWSNLHFPFNNRVADTKYATMEQNYFKLDGSMTFLPEGEYAQYKNSIGLATEELLGTVTVSFPVRYDIKGLTIEFEEWCYPTEFVVRTEEKELTYSNSEKMFSTTDTLGETNYITITPVSMVGGQQRLRISNIIMGVGLNFGNNEIQSAKLTEFVHSVSEELPSMSFSLTVWDADNQFSVDDSNSFVNYLETGQTVSVSVGLELDDETVEWLEILNAPLSDWKSTKGKMSFTAKDIFAFLSETYAAGNTIHSRTLYADAEAVLADLGLEPDEYEIDECLKDITITNPLPESSHAECLQLIANAGRCILFQNAAGKICLKANFANVLDPDEMVVEAEGASAWSKPENVLIGSNYVYADMTKDFFSLDGSMFFMPEDGEKYLETGFVSAYVADENGIFSRNILKASAQTKTVSGVTFTQNLAGIVSWNGTATNTPTTWRDTSNVIHLQKGVSYVFSEHGENTDSNSYARLFSITDNALLSPETWLRYEKSVVIVPEKDIDVCVEYRLSKESLSEGCFKTQLEVGTKMTNYQPPQENPSVTITLPAGYVYYGVNICFDGNPPQEMVITTYYNDTLQETITYTELDRENILNHEYKVFDKMTFTFTKASPNDRVLVNKVSFGDLSDYVLREQDMYEKPVAYREIKKKSVAVKLFSFSEDEKGVPQEIEDRVYFTQAINETGECVVFENQLISTEEHAQLVAEWLGNYYANNVSYSISKFRGEPRLQAADIIHMENEYLPNLQIEITKRTFSFNGVFSGSVEARRALRMMEGK